VVILDRQNLTTYVAGEIKVVTWYLVRYTDGTIKFTKEVTP